MIPTGKQIRDGRLLVRWSEAELAAAAGIKVEIVMRAEQVDGIPMLKRSDSAVIQQALEAAGVEFIPEIGDAAGVRLRKGET